MAWLQPDFVVSILNKVSSVCHQPNHEVTGTHRGKWKWAYLEIDLSLGSSVGWHYIFWRPKIWALGRGIFFLIFGSFQIMCKCPQHEHISLSRILIKDEARWRRRVGEALPLVSCGWLWERRHHGNSRWVVLSFKPAEFKTVLEQTMKESDSWLTPQFCVLLAVWGGLFFLPVFSQVKGREAHRNLITNDANGGSYSGRRNESLVR